MSARPFEIVCEIEPPVRPDLTHARHQIGVLTAVSSTFLIPDNHIGRATVSSMDPLPSGLPPGNRPPRPGEVRAPTHWLSLRAGPAIVEPASSSSVMP